MAAGAGAGAGGTAAVVVVVVVAGSKYGGCGFHLAEDGHMTQQQGQQ